MSKFAPINLFEKDPKLYSLLVNSVDVDVDHVDFSEGLVIPDHEENPWLVGRPNEFTSPVVGGHDSCVVIADCRDTSKNVMVPTSALRAAIQAELLLMSHGDFSISVSCPGCLREKFIRDIEHTRKCLIHGASVHFEKLD